jgi:hypothetical protein
VINDIFKERFGDLNRVKEFASDVKLQKDLGFEYESMNMNDGEKSPELPNVISMFASGLPTSVTVKPADSTEVPSISPDSRTRTTTPLYVPYSNGCYLYANANIGLGVLVLKNPEIFKIEENTIKISLSNLKTKFTPDELLLIRKAMRSEECIEGSFITITDISGITDTDQTDLNKFLDEIDKNLSETPDTTQTNINVFFKYRPDLIKLFDEYKALIRNDQGEITSIKIRDSIRDDLNKKAIGPFDEDEINRFIEWNPPHVKGLLIEKIHDNTLTGYLDANSDLKALVESKLKIKPNPPLNIVGETIQISQSNLQIEFTPEEQSIIRKTMLDNAVSKFITITEQSGSLQEFFENLDKI